MDMNKHIIPIVRKMMPVLVAQSIVGVQPRGISFEEYSKWFIQRKYNKKYWPYQYAVFDHSVIEVERWCWTNFKGRYWHSDCRTFVFKRQKDYAWFMLKWG
jgi:hypothetical protein